MNGKKMSILAVNVLFFMTIWSADPLPERGALFIGSATAAETPLSRSVEASLASHVYGLTGATLKTSNIQAPVPVSVSGDVSTRGSAPLARITDMVLSRAKMGSLNATLCEELGLGNGRDRCPSRQVSIKTSGALDIFDAIENSSTGRIDIVLFHQLYGEDGNFSEAYLYLTSPDAELRRTIYGKRHEQRQLLSNEQASSGFIKTVYYWVSQEQDLLKKLSQ